MTFQAVDESLFIIFGKLVEGQKILKRHLETFHLLLRGRNTEVWPALKVVVGDVLSLQYLMFGLITVESDFELAFVERGT